jgi:hypothetical protein
MTHYLVAICILFISVIGSAQSKFVPTIITLYPTKIKTDSISSLELKSYEQTGVVTEQLRKEFLREGLAPNWRLIRQRELDFMDTQNFFTLLVLSTTRELTYKEMENRNNLLIFPLKQTQDNALPLYKKTADQHKVSWVINLLQCETQVQGENRSLKVLAQLYNVVTNRIYLDKIYVADSSTLSPSETCNDTWLCLGEAVQKAMVIDLSDKIEKNIRHERP